MITQNFNGVVDRPKSFAALHCGCPQQRHQPRRSSGHPPLRLLMALRYTVKLTRPGVDPRNPAFADEMNLTPAQLYTLPEDAIRKTLSFNARFGGRLPNSIGHVLPPGSGFIQLGNVGGDFYLFANNPNFDQNPGARCFIDVTDTEHWYHVQALAGMDYGAHHDGHPRRPEVRPS